MKRFWSKVDKSGPKQLHMKTRCWIWVGSIDKEGYGRFNFKGKNALAHRVAFVLTVSSVSSNNLVLHDCDVRKCVRPTHLHPGTHADNRREAFARGRAASTKGSLNGKAKFTERQVRQIRSIKHLSNKQIAAKYGVSTRLVWEVRTFHTWRHL